MHIFTRTLTPRMVYHTTSQAQCTCIETQQYPLPCPTSLLDIQTQHTCTSPTTYMHTCIYMCIHILAHVCTPTCTCTYTCTVPVLKAGYLSVLLILCWLVCACMGVYSLLDLGFLPFFSSSATTLAM